MTFRSVSGVSSRAPAPPPSSRRLPAARPVTPRGAEPTHHAPSARQDAALGAFASAARGTGLDAAHARDLDVGARLDAVRDAYAGPYSVDGRQVTSPPMFRINLGHNTDAMKAHAKELDRIAARAGVNGYVVRMGFGSPADLRKVTQALIDAGKLPPGPPGTEAERIRRMQWEWGIGVDCAAYTGAALTRATGRGRAALGLAPAGTEGFRGLDRNPHFRKVPPSEVRPGDVITLDAIGDYGHNVIVRGRTTADAPTRARLSREHPELATFLSSSGPHHLIEVDSSWGAGADGASYGGFRRDTWIHDESTGRWAYLDRHESPERWRVSERGPAGDIFHGAYRVKP